MDLNDLVIKIRNHIQAAEIAVYMASLICNVDPEKAMELDAIHDEHINHAANLLFENLLKGDTTND